MFWGIKEMVQTGFVVDDLDTEIARWEEKGAGRFLTFKDIEVPLNFRGKDAVLKLSIALSQFEGVQIELIQQLDRQPSPFADSFPETWPTGESGFHHVGMISSDFDLTCAKMTEAGYALAMSGAFGGYRFAYFDTRETLGFFYEIFEDNEAMRGFFAQIRNA